MAIDITPFLDSARSLASAEFHANIGSTEATAARTRIMICCAQFAGALNYFERLMFAKDIRQND